MYRFFLLIFICVGILSCNTIATKKGASLLPIQQINYYVRYLEVGNELQAEAQFRADSLASFLIVEGVFLNDYKMKVKNLPPIGWQHKLIKKTTPLDSFYIFSFKRSQEYTQQDSLQFKVLTDLKLATPKIARKTGGLIQWQGTALNKDDALTLLFEDSKGANFTINHVGGTRGAQLEIRPEHIAALAKGWASLSIIQKRQEVSNKENTKIVKKLEFYYKPLKVEILE